MSAINIYDYYKWWRHVTVDGRLVHLVADGALWKMDRYLSQEKDVSTNCSWCWTNSWYTAQKLQAIYYSILGHHHHHKREIRMDCWPIERFHSISPQFIITFSWGHINISSDKQIGLQYWVLHSSDHYYSEHDIGVTFNSTFCRKRT